MSVGTFVIAACVEVGLGASTTPLVLADDWAELVVVVNGLPGSFASTEELADARGSLIWLAAEPASAARRV